jgi:hypothetical protein
VPRSRGLITNTEWERIAEKTDEEPEKRYQAVSRVRRRIQEELPKEMAMLAEHKPELLAELQEVVCEAEENES